MRLYLSISLVVLVCLVGCFSCGWESTAAAQSEEQTHQVTLGPDSILKGDDILVKTGDKVEWTNESDIKLTLNLNPCRRHLDLTIDDPDLDKNTGHLSITSKDIKTLTVVEAPPKGAPCRYRVSTAAEVGADRREWPENGTIRGGGG